MTTTCPVCDVPGYFEQPEGTVFPARCPGCGKSNFPTHCSICGKSENDDAKVADHSDGESVCTRCRGQRPFTGTP